MTMQETQKARNLWREVEDVRYVHVGPIIRYGVKNLLNW
jgi:hypothetical protein